MERTREAGRRKEQEELDKTWRSLYLCSYKLTAVSGVETTSRTARTVGLIHKQAILRNHHPHLGVGVSSYCGGVVEGENSRGTIRGTNQKG